MVVTGSLHAKFDYVLPHPLLQVSIGTITPSGAADVDGRLQTGDELLYVDGQSVAAASHRKVVSLMKNANEAGRVSLGIKRRLNPQQQGKLPLCLSFLMVPRGHTPPIHSLIGLCTKRASEKRLNPLTGHTKLLKTALTVEMKHFSVIFWLEKSIF